MPAFTTIADIALAEGKPVRDIDTRALRDNPLAIAEGNDTAPWISPNAFFSTVTAGSDLRFRNHYEVLNNAYEEVIAFQVQVFCSGTLTMKCDQQANGTDTLKSKMWFYRNRSTGISTLGSWERTATGTWSTRSVNVSVLPGDLLIVTHDKQSTNRSRAKDFSLFTGGEYLWAVGDGALVLPTRPSGS